MRWLDPTYAPRILTSDRQR